MCEMRYVFRTSAFSLLCVLLSSAVYGGPADIEYVTLYRTISGWTAEVVMKHEDRGWGHFADHIVVFDDRGRRVARSDIKGPFSPSQRPPFFRVYLPEFPGNTASVIFRAHCKVHGYGGRQVSVDLKKSKGEDFRILKAPFNWRKYQRFHGEGDFFRTPRARRIVESREKKLWFEKKVTVHHRPEL